VEVLLGYTQVLVWPLVIVGLVWMLRRQIRSLLDRLSSAKWGPVQADFQQQLEAHSEEPGPPVEVSGDALQQEYDDWQEAYSQEIAERDAAIQKLVEENAGWRTAYHFERTYNLIFGSQIRLLEYLAGRGDAGADLRGVYAFYAGAHFVPEGYPFQSYMGFLKTQGVVEESPPNGYRITELGVRFIVYLNESKHNKLKPF